MSDMPFTKEVTAYLQHSHTDLNGRRPGYDEETCKFSAFQWSPSTIKPVIFQIHKEELDRKLQKKENCISRHEQPWKTANPSQPIVAGPVHLYAQEAIGHQRVYIRSQTLTGFHIRATSVFISAQVFNIEWGRYSLCHVLIDLLAYLFFILFAVIYSLNSNLNL